MKLRILLRAMMNGKIDSFTSLLKGTFYLLGIFLIVKWLFNSNTSPPSPVDKRLSDMHDLDLYRFNKTPSPITFVTAYFLFGKCKHGTGSFSKWIENFVKTLQAPLVIYTQPSLAEWIINLRKGLPLRVVLLDEIWDTPWLFSENLGRHIYLDYHKIHKIDPEQFRHSPELYAVWNSKLWMVNHTAEKNPFRSKYFFWIDIGSVRIKKPYFKDFPDLERVEQVFHKEEGDEDKLLVSCIGGPPYDRDLTSLQDLGKINFVTGGFLGGTKESIAWYASTFYKLHDERLALGQWVGKDQALYNMIVLTYPERFNVVCKCLLDKVKQKLCGDGWFYFQYWFSKSGAICRNGPMATMREFLEIMKHPKK